MIEDKHLYMMISNYDRYTIVMLFTTIDRIVHHYMSLDNKTRFIDFISSTGRIPETILPLTTACTQCVSRVSFDRSNSPI